jgi:hypothetical protein
MGPPDAGNASSFSVRTAGPWLVVVLLAAGLLSHFKITEPDVFWHLKTGQVILETGRLVRTNLFSGSYPNYPWHNLEWLHQVVLAAAYDGLGWTGVAALKAALALATAGVVFFTLLRRAPRPGLAAAVTVIVLVAIRFRLSERPHLFSHLFLAATIWAVERSRREGGRIVWLLPPLFALWSNIHPELTLGLAYLAAACAGDWIDGRRGTHLPAGTLRRHLAALLLSAAATLANPETFRVVLTPFSLLAGGPADTPIHEFQRTTFATEPVFWVLAAAVALALLASRESRRWSTMLPLALLGAVGVMYVRTVTAFALAAAPLIHGGLAAVAAGGGARRRRLVAFATAAVVVGALLWSVLLDRRAVHRWGSGPDEQFVPEAAANFILANNLPPNLYNRYNEGGYLVFRLYPRLGVFQDGRGADPPAFAAALASATDGLAFERLLNQHRVATALVFTPEASQASRAGAWGVVFWDDTFALLVRRSPDNIPLLDRLEYRAYLPGRRIPTDQAGQALALREMRRNQEERARPSWRLAVETATLLRQQRDFAGAEGELRRAVAIAPGEPDAWASLSALLTTQGRSAEAAAAYAQAQRLEHSPWRGVRSALFP